MTTPLGDFFRQNVWANLRLIDVLAALDTQQLTASAAGTFGSIHATLRHLAANEERYLALLTGEWPDPAWYRGETLPDLATMRAHMEASGNGFIAYTDAYVPGGTAQGEWGGRITTVPTIVVVMQAIYHATEHRTNITTVLAQQGLPTPDLDAWAYNEAQAGRAAK
ncbi:MAG: damage-inducible protein DinB [Ktedonobacterales bacterium]|nr:damage-inducible protein DinB [Ktedonobacterales bacterium]